MKLQIARHKVSDVEEVMNLLLATRSCFRHTALDHVQKITLIQARKRHEILATVSIKINPQLYFVPSYFFTLVKSLIVIFYICRQISTLIIVQPKAREDVDSRIRSPFAKYSLLDYKYVAAEFLSAKIFVRSFCNYTCVQITVTPAERFY